VLLPWAVRLFGSGAFVAGYATTPPNPQAGLYKKVFRGNLNGGFYPIIVCPPSLILLDFFSK